MLFLGELYSSYRRRRERKLMAESRTTGTAKGTKVASTTVKTTSSPVTGAATSTPTPTDESKTSASAPRRVEYGPRLGVTLSVDIVANAFHNATASQSVRYVQYALHERGFEPGNDQGVVDFDTRRAYAEFQRTVDESPTGVPTNYSLDVLGFDVT